MKKNVLAVAAALAAGALTLSHRDNDRHQNGKGLHIDDGVDPAVGGGGDGQATVLSQGDGGQDAQQQQQGNTANQADAGGQVDQQQQQGNTANQADASGNQEGQLQQQADPADQAADASNTGADKSAEQQQT